MSSIILNNDNVLMVYIYSHSVYLLVILVTGLGRISKRIAYGNSKLAVKGIDWSMVSPIYGIDNSSTK